MWSALAPTRCLVPCRTGGGDRFRTSTVAVGTATVETTSRRQPIRAAATFRRCVRGGGGQAEDRAERRGSTPPSDVGLGAFLAELDERLQALGPAGVRSSLRAAAARLSPSERPAFLAIFEADASCAATISLRRSTPSWPASLRWSTSTRRRDGGTDADGTGGTTRTIRRWSRRSMICTDDLVSASWPATGRPRGTAIGGC